MPDDSARSETVEDYKSNVAYISRNLRKVPHNKDAEMMLLGALLMNAKTYDYICDITKEEHFSLAEHKSIFSACKHILDRGGVADPVTMKDWAEACPYLDGPKGKEYLAQLCAVACPSTSAHVYANQLADLHKRRQILQLHDDINDKAYACDVEISADELIEYAEGRLFGMSDESQIGDFVKAGEVVGDIFDQAQEALRRGKAGMSLGIETGIKDLDDKIGGLQAGDFVLLAGRPSMGKTTAAMSIAYNIAKAYRKHPDKKGEVMSGGKVAFFSMETNGRSIVRQNLVARVTGLSGQQLRNPSKHGITEQQITEARHKAEDGLKWLPLVVMDRITTVAGIRTALRRKMRRSGVHIAIIDYLGLIKTNNSKLPIYQQVSDISQGLKSLARELGIPIIVLAQLNREVEGRDCKRPTPSDLRDSGKLEQDADVIIFVYREHHYLSKTKPEKMDEETYAKKCEDTRSEMDLIVAKNRQGPLGTAKAYYNPELAIVDNMERTTYSPAYQGVRR